MRQVRVPKETQEQKQLIAWCEYQKNIYPELDLIFHIVNEGKRSKRTGAELKRMGMKKGVPDICLPVPRGMYHGLWIELKADKTKRATKEQKEWLVKLTKQGYKAVMCYGAEDANTGEVIGCFRSSREAAKNLYVGKTAVINSLNRKWKTNIAAGAYIFEYEK